MSDYGNGNQKPARTWDYSLSVADYMDIEAPASQYSVKIFQWVSKKGRAGETSAGSAAFRCRGNIGDGTAVDAAEIFIRALNDGYPSEKVFKEKKSGSFLRSNDLPRYLPIQYVKWEMAAEGCAATQPAPAQPPTGPEQLSLLSYRR